MQREELEELFCFKIGRELERFKEEMRELDEAGGFPYAGTADSGPWRTGRNEKNCRKE